MRRYRPFTATKLPKQLSNSGLRAAILHRGKQWIITAQKQSRAHKKSNKNRKSTKPQKEDDLRILDESFNDEEEILQSIMADEADIEGDDLEQVIDSDDEDENIDDDGWGVSTGQFRGVEVEPTSAKRGTKKTSEVDDRWRDIPALQSLPSHVFNELRSFQEEADQLSKQKQKDKIRTDKETKTHRKLRIISGAFAGKRLLSGKGETTRPMMEKVRAAAFNMLMSRCGDMLRLPENSTWLDLFAGTGSVGLEAMSRGVKEAHFIELDPWVVRKVLSPNLEHCQVAGKCSVHNMKAEEYLQRAVAAPSYATSFDFISVCPPYLKVSYDEVFSLLENSPLLHAETYIVVEYPTKSAFSLPEAIGPLHQLRDRKFGRTRLALFGPQ